jgi:hypothetical protein
VSARAAFAAAVVDVRIRHLWQQDATFLSRPFVAVRLLIEDAAMLGVKPCQWIASIPQRLQEFERIAALGYIQVEAAPDVGNGLQLGQFSRMGAAALLASRQILPRGLRVAAPRPFRMTMVHDASSCFARDELPHDASRAEPESTSLATRQGPCF